MSLEGLSCLQIEVRLFYFYFPHVSATLQPLIACDYGGCFVCVLVVLLLV